MLKPVVARAVLLSTSAIAQTYDRADIVRGLCWPDGCDEFAILAASPQGKGGDGTLMQTRLKTFHASSSGRRELSGICRNSAFLARGYGLYWRKRVRQDVQGQAF